MSISPNELQFIAHDNERVVLLAAMGAMAVVIRLVIAWVTRGVSHPAGEPTQG